MTQEDFLAFYPQFDHLFPPAVLADALSRANARFADFGADREAARRLFAAHLLTLYAFTAVPEGTEPSLLLLSSAGRNRSSRPVASRKVGEVQVTYASSDSLSSASTALADLTETGFGLQLLTLIRQHASPLYIP